MGTLAAWVSVGESASQPAPTGLSIASTILAGLIYHRKSAGALYPVPLSLLSNSNSVDGSEANWASVCPLRTGFVYILPLQLSGPWLLLVRLPPR